ncbi:MULTISPECIES: hypothetical protein [Clostridium]|uniref:hypothetical protein n=1 Tax=Clostridium TaxID=1485 RepID=UPI0005FBD895|nr:MULTISPECIES: hypothetical protein [Clostridium]
MLKESQIEGIPLNDRQKYTSFLNGLKDGSLKTLLESVPIDKENIWNKDFGTYISKDFEEKWDEYKNMRNMIAHNKLICRVIKDKIINYSEEISEELNEINRRLELFYENQEKEYAQKMWSQLEEEQYITDAGGEALPDESDVLCEIDENCSYSSMINEIEDRLRSVEIKSEEVSGNIENIINYYNNDDVIIDKAKLMDICKILEYFKFEKDDFKRECIKEIDSQQLLDRFLPDIFDELYSLVENLNNFKYDVSDNFYIGTLVQYHDIYSNNVEIISDGIISPTRGDKDDITIKLNINEKMLAVGEIEKTYFDYSVNDDGIGMPEVEEYLEVNLDEIEEEVLSNLEEEISILDEVAEILNNNFVQII